MKRAIVLLAFAVQALPQLQPQADLHLAVGVHAQHALDRPIAGAAVVVGRGGVLGPAVERAFGFADAARKIPLTTSTIFHIDSVSKHIEAAVALRLVEQGTLSLDEDVTKYVPEAPTQGRRVTVRQLLNHTSGLHSYTSLPAAAANEQRDLSHAEVLALIRDQPFDFEPGTSWRYNNSGFYLAGMVIERVTGQPYAEYVRDRVFRPLGMTSSSLCTSHDVVAGLAAGHDVRGGVLVPAQPITWALPFAAGAICSTARDLLAWQKAIENGRFISRAHVEEMRQPTILADGTRIDYGLGTRLGSLQGHPVIGHTGSGAGFNAILEFFPADRLTVIVLTNTDNGGALPLATAIARSALEIAPPPIADLSVPEDEAAALTGTFDSDDGAIENYACADKLCFRPPGAAQGFPSHRQAPFVYAIDADRELRFSPGPAPVAWGFLYGGGLLVDAKRRLPVPVHRAIGKALVQAGQ